MLTPFALEPSVAQGDQGFVERAELLIDALEVRWLDSFRLSSDICGIYPYKLEPELAADFISAFPLLERF